MHLIYFIAYQTQQKCRKVTKSSIKKNTEDDVCNLL